MCSSAFLQFAPIRSLTDMLSSSLILSDIFSRCPISYLLVSIFSICILKFKPILKTISAACYFDSTNHKQIIGNFTIESFHGYWCSLFFHVKPFYKDSICNITNSWQILNPVFQKRRYRKVIKLFIFKVTYKVLASTIFFINTYQPWVIDENVWHNVQWRNIFFWLIILQLRNA